MSALCSLRFLLLGRCMHTTSTNPLHLQFLCPKHLLPGSLTDPPSHLPRDCAQTVNEIHSAPQYLHFTPHCWGLPWWRRRICLPMQETQVRSLGWDDPLEKEMATHSSTLAWEISRIEEPGGLQSMGLQSQTRLSD